MCIWTCVIEYAYLDLCVWMCVFGCLWFVCLDVCAASEELSAVEIEFCEARQAQLPASQMISLNGIWKQLNWRRFILDRVGESHISKQEVDHFTENPDGKAFWCYHLENWVLRELGICVRPLVAEPISAFLSKVAGIGTGYWVMGMGVRLGEPLVSRPISSWSTCLTKLTTAPAPNWMGRAPGRRCADELWTG